MENFLWLSSVPGPGIPGAGVSFLGPMELAASAETKCDETTAGQCRCWGWVDEPGVLGVQSLQLPEYFAAVAAASCICNWEDLGWTHFLRGMCVWLLCCPDGKKGRNSVHSERLVSVGCTVLSAQELYLVEVGAESQFLSARSSQRVAVSLGPTCRNRLAGGLRLPVLAW